MHGKPDGTGPSERRSRPRLVSGRGPPLRGGKDSPERAYRSEDTVSAGVQSSQTAFVIFGKIYRLSGFASNRDLMALARRPSGSEK